MNPSQLTSNKDFAKNQNQNDSGNPFGILTADQSKNDAMNFTMGVIELSPFKGEFEMFIKLASLALLPLKAMVSNVESVFRKNTGELHISFFRTYWGLTTMIGLFYILPLFLAKTSLTKPTLLVPIAFVICLVFAIINKVSVWRRNARGELSYPRSRGVNRFERFLPSFVSETALYYVLEPLSLFILSIVFSKVDIYFAVWLFFSGFGLFWLRQLDYHFLRIDWLNKVAMFMEKEHHEWTLTNANPEKRKAYEKLGVQGPPSTVVEATRQISTIGKKSADSVLESVMGSKNNGKASVTPKPVTT